MKKIVDFPGNLPSDEQAPFDPLEYGPNVNYSDEHAKAVAKMCDEIVDLHLSNRQVESLMASLRLVREITDRDAFLTGFEVATKFFTGKGLK